MKALTLHSARVSAIRAAMLAGTLLLIPLGAMQFTGEVDWGPEDFLVAGMLLFAAAFAWQLAIARSGNRLYRLAMAIAILASLFLVWANLAVGITGSENNPANDLYFGVPLVGLLGGVIVRFRPIGMGFVLLAMAMAQILAALFASRSVPGSEWSELLIINGVFVALYCSSAWLFRCVARKRGIEPDSVTA